VGLLVGREEGGRREGREGKVERGGRNVERGSELIETIESRTFPLLACFSLSLNLASCTNRP
jgi:hypothetical protein